jgi:predicted nucleic acid-binding protein
VSVYLDASVLVSLFVPDANSQRAFRTLRRTSDSVVVSDFAAAEFASAIAKRVRMTQTTRADALSAFLAFDAWSANCAQSAELTTQDISDCVHYLRRLDHPLRAPDAIHVAIAKRCGAKLFTFDASQRAFAKRQGLDVL